MSKIVSKHFVEFLSPGTFTSEVTTREIDSWNVALVAEMARSVLERHGATPYGFRFITRSRGEDDLDSHKTASSNIYYLGGTVRTLEQVLADNLPDEDNLRWNMKANGVEQIIVNTNSWKFTSELRPEDVVLDWTPVSFTSEPSHDR